MKTTSAGGRFESPSQPFLSPFNLAQLIEIPLFPGFSQKLLKNASICLQSTLSPAADTTLRPALHAPATLHSQNPHGTAVFCTVPRNQIFSHLRQPSVFSPLGASLAFGIWVLDLFPTMLTFLAQVPDFFVFLRQFRKIDSCSFVSICGSTPLPASVLFHSRFPATINRAPHRIMPWRILQRSLLLLATFLALNLESPAATATKPNIIFIMADDLGYGELGSYGQRKIKTPNLDRMAREGMRFTRFYAGSTVCAPSRSVLMTGQHTGHTTVRGNAGGTNRTAQTLRSHDVTVAEVLKSAGYRTGLIGKWGLGMPRDEGHPNRQGFDYFFGYLSQLHAHNHFPDHLWRNSEKVPLPNRIVPLGEDGAGYATNAVRFAGDLFAEEVLDFIDRSTNQPFFLYFCPVVPHANNERKKALGNGMEVPDFGPYKDEPWEDALKGHAAMVTRLDADIARIRQHLRVAGLEKDTLIIFTSDNGPHKEGGQDPS